MSFQNEMREEVQEQDFEPDYPFGGSVEPYDIARDEEDEEEPGYECDSCGSTVEGFHNCSCGEELTEKQCRDWSGLCLACSRMT